MDTFQYFGNPTYSQVGLPRKTGNIYFVDGDLGNDNFAGTNPAEAFKTIGKALQRVQSGRGDVIWVYPKSSAYAENLVVTQSDLSILSASVHGNSKRVAIAPAAGIALDLGNINRFRMRGIRGVGTGDVGVLSSAEGALYEDCDFTSDTTHGFQFFGRSSASFTGSGTDFVRCLFRECGAQGLSSKIGVGGAVGLYPTNVNVYGCQFYLNTGADIGNDNPGGAVAPFSQWLIHACQFMTVDKAVYLAMSSGSGTTELQISGCWFSENTALTNVKIALPAGASFVGNFQATGVVDGSGF